MYIKLKKAGSKIEHQGIRLEFIGQIGKIRFYRKIELVSHSSISTKELYYDRSNHHEFQALSKLLLYPGDITENLALEFNFPNVDKPYESYAGVNVKLR